MNGIKYELTAPYSYGRELNDQKQRVEYARAPIPLDEARPVPRQLRLDVARNLERLIQMAQE